MNRIDLALVLIGALCALRGYWRGFFREGFGTVAIVAGVAAAFRWAGTAAALLEQLTGLPTAILAGVAFVVVFAVAYTLVASVGFVVDWLARGSLPAVVDGGAGAAFGLAKFGLVAAVVLLFLDLLPLVPWVPAHLDESALARRLISVASRTLRTDAEPPPAPVDPDADARS